MCAEHVAKEATVQTGLCRAVWQIRGIGAQRWEARGLLYLVAESCEFRSAGTPLNQCKFSAGSFTHAPPPARNPPSNHERHLPPALCFSHTGGRQSFRSFPTPYQSIRTREARGLSPSSPSLRLPLAQRPSLTRLTSLTRLVLPPSVGPAPWHWKARSTLSPPSLTSCLTPFPLKTNKP
jgi:hypothetical protein